MPSNRTSLPRVCFLSYRHIREFALPVIAEYADRADIEVVDGTFDGAVAVAQDRIRNGQVDAFVSAGSNAYILRSGVRLPVATIQLGGFDLLQALIKARRISSRVGVVMYGQTIPELDEVKTLLNIEIAQYAYRTPDDARRRFEQLREAGFEVIVGSSLVVELAQEAGLHGLLAYSLASIRKGFEDAIELARVARLEASRYEQLNGVLHNLQEAVLAVDRQHRIVAVNPPMQQLLGRAQGLLLGEPLDEVEPRFSLQSTLEGGVQEDAVVQRLGQRDWVAHRTPIRERGEVTGAALTLYDARVIHEADTSLRIQQRRRQGAARHGFVGMVGASAALQEAIASARRFARTDLTVLITGESGVGKELFAQAIHNDSARAGRPFVAVNCAAFPEALLESELFGHEEGAFTGARRGGRRGLFETAHTGTLFLDEIGDMPLPLQSRLLRVLQEREITRLGATAPIPVDVRVIVATHQPLRAMVAERRFRQDLYYRIATLPLPLPPLRERRDDIAPLAQALLARCLDRHGHRLDPGRALAPLLAELAAYDWPGNVRELENIVERMAVRLLRFDTERDIVHDELRRDCPEVFEPRPAAAPPLADDEVPTRERIAAAMAAAGGRRQQAAKALGVSRSTLWRWLKEAG
ncbi:propionate catabolism operon regulatory protein PrpR [Xylophilus sp. GOD-11R]|uniref:propionate catabolism operon regulatory protein PrpR n=1 Tax=Xylophilus sp. GOD-11R TaxID=3089814 RepID=UPI00298CF9FE|nr:propionate catabolism operon regulatory protein PrpR [Xylophilus sp. GOD-11R]WPB59476.1 propionate catabolism operon regulatory protein PrpR [Xylophilus sp. GOD-11R]